MHTLNSQNELLLISLDSNCKFSTPFEKVNYTQKQSNSSIENAQFHLDA